MFSSACGALFHEVGGERFIHKFGQGYIVLGGWEHVFEETDLLIIEHLNKQKE